MNETILVKIITPLSIAFEKQAKMVTMPGEEGMFGVLPGHAPMIVNLKAGLVQVYIDDMHKSENTYLISGGVTEVTANYINIATETAINVTNLSEAEIATKLLKNLYQININLFEKSTFWDKVILMSLRGELHSNSTKQSQDI